MDFAECRVLFVVLFAENAVNHLVPLAGYNFMTDNSRVNGVPNEIFRRNFFCRLVKFLLERNENTAAVYYIYLISFLEKSSISSLLVRK